MSEMSELGMEAALVQINKNLYDERIRMKGRLFVARELPIWPSTTMTTNPAKPWKSQKML